MKLFSTVSDMQEMSVRDRRDGRRIFFVPTMGALHDGHMSLIKRAQDHPSFVEGRDRVVVSIFVNPTQFNDPKDLLLYPKPLETDLDYCEKAKVDYVFLPSALEMYPTGFQSKVCVSTLTQGLCGKSRPGHFDGVTTVVLKLLNSVAPHVACFGEKDFQQLAVIRRMVLDLNLSVEILACPTLREQDGLAMSSRNVRLSNADRQTATILYRALDYAQERFAKKETDCTQLRKEILKLIEDAPRSRVDYVEFVHEDTLSSLTTYLPGKTRLALALFLGEDDAVRLIDNRLY